MSHELPSDWTEAHQIYVRRRRVIAAFDAVVKIAIIHRISKRDKLIKVGRPIIVQCRYNSTQINPIIYGV